MVEPAARILNLILLTCGALTSIHDFARTLEAEREGRASSYDPSRPPTVELLIDRASGLDDLLKALECFQAGTGCLVVLVQAARLLVCNVEAFAGTRTIHPIVNSLGTWHYEPTALEIAAEAARIRALWEAWMTPAGLDRIEREARLLKHLDDDVAHDLDVFALHYEPATTVDHTSGAKGLTKSELIAAVPDRKISSSTFDSIREVAGVDSPGKGRAGQKHQYSADEIYKMIEAARSGQFRDGQLFAMMWSRVLARLL